MSRVSSLTFGLLAVVGSILGLASMLPLLVQGSLFGFPGELFLFLTTALYGFGLWSGVQAIRQRAGWPSHARWFWLAQVPAVASPVLSFFISCAAGAWIYVRFGPNGLGAGVSAYLGSGLRWSYGQGTPELAIGVNVLAACLALLLFSKAKVEVRRPHP